MRSRSGLADRSGGRDRPAGLRFRLRSSRFLKENSAMRISGVTVAANRAPLPISADGQEFVTISDAQFLFNADFKRTGSVLPVTGQDGPRVVVSDVQST